MSTGSDNFIDWWNNRSEDRQPRWQQRLASEAWHARNSEFAALQRELAAVNSELNCKMATCAGLESSVLHLSGLVDELRAELAFRKSCEVVMREKLTLIAGYQGMYASDENPTIRAIKRLATEGIAGLPAPKTGEQP